jgi:hypothetical protein
MNTRLHSRIASGQMRGGGFILVPMFLSRNVPSEFEACRDGENISDAGGAVVGPCLNPAIFRR